MMPEGATPLERMSEDKLLKLAGKAMRRASALPARSPLRAIQWAVYDRYAGELGRRAAAVVAGISGGDAG